MKTKMLLIAASTFAISACGGTEVDTAENDAVDGAEVAVNEDQPPLEGDSPFTSEEDVADSQYTSSDPMATDPYAADPYAADPMASQQETLAGNYDIEIEGLDEPKVLIIDPNETTGTFDSEPIRIGMNGDEFTFDAPITLDDEEQLMTFTARYVDGAIEDGRVEAQGDGMSRTFEATPAAEFYTDELDEEMGEIRSDVNQVTDETVPADPLDMNDTDSSDEIDE